MHYSAKKILMICILLLSICISGCGSKTNDKDGETLSTAEAGKPLYLDGEKLEPVSVLNESGFNIYTYNIKNLFYCKNDMILYSESDDTDTKYSAYVLDGDTLVKTEKESFEFALYYDKLYPVGTELPDDYDIEKMVMNHLKYGDREMYYYIFKGLNLDFYPIKIDDERLLVDFYGTGYPMYYYVYNLSDGSIKAVIDDLGTTVQDVEYAEFSGNFRSVLFSGCESNGNTAYYYADLNRNEYVNVKDVFDIELHYYDEGSDIGKPTRFIWVEADKYMFIVPTDDGYSIYKCDLASKNCTLVEDGLKVAEIVECNDGRHGKSILIVDSEGKLKVLRPSENKEVSFEGKTDTDIYTSYFHSVECDDIISFAENGMDSMYLDWDNGITFIKNADIMKHNNFLRDGNDIYVFQ